MLTGSIERGESLKIGYYRQTGIVFNPEDTVLDVVNDTWLLGKFLFTHDMLNNRIEKFERRGRKTPAVPADDTEGGNRTF